MCKIKLFNRIVDLLMGIYFLFDDRMFEDHTNMMIEKSCSTTDPINFSIKLKSS